MMEEFLKVYKSFIRRDGAEQLLTWLETSDFFTAPASTRYHGSEVGGLVAHSVCVYEKLRELVSQESFDISDETVAICALLHDVCKVDFYKVSSRNVKDDMTGQWNKVPYYTVEDKVPYGHGEKSVMIVSDFMKLTMEERMAIRWHMGGYDASVQGGSYAIGEACNKYPLITLVQMADMYATYVEKR